MNSQQSIACLVIGLPKGQPRVKAFRRGAHAGVYDPGTADGWKFLVRTEVAANWDRVKMEGPVKVTLGFNFPRPKSHQKTNGELKPNAPSRHTSKPDADNLAKAVCDALTNLGVWRDDSQVAELTVTKYYGLQSGCEIDIEPIL